MKKLAYIFISLVGFVTNTYSQNTYPSSGNVGLGTLSPSSNLVINGTGTVETQILTDNAPTSRPIISFARSVNFWNLGMNMNQGNNDDFHFRFMNNYFFTLKSNGNIGMGTSNPDSRLTIENGTLNLNATSNFGGDYPTSNGNYSNVLSIGGIGAETGLKIYKQNSGNSPTFLGGANYIDTYVFEMTDSNDPNPDGGILFGATGNDNVFDKLMTIRGNGNVGIGTTDPKNLLDVKGTIHAQEVKVDMNNWSDFVFHPSYQLKPLTEVEQFIKANGHLHDIPSAAEVEQNGVKVGEMQKKLLQKVEELTLYVIEKDKEIAAQQEMLMELKKEIELLKTK